jgi:hypothetical protein
MNKQINQSSILPNIAARKTAASATEIPLDVIDRKLLRIVSEAAFTDENGQPALCMGRKFHSIEQIQNFLDKADRSNVKVYVYKLYELSEHGQDLQPTGVKYYHLRCAVRETDEHLLWK